MPLRIRDIHGVTTVMPSQAFVEITTTDDPPMVAQVSYQDDRGLVHVITQGDPEAARYAAMFKVKFAPVVAVALERYPAIFSPSRS